MVSKRKSFFIVGGGGGGGGRLGIGKKVTIFVWEWGQNLAPGDGQKIPLLMASVSNQG